MSTRDTLFGGLRSKDAAEFLGISKSTFLRWVREGYIPQGVRLSTRCTVWRIKNLEEFLEREETLSHELQKNA